MYLYHKTNLESALNIVESNMYIPHSIDTFNGDACLNCFCSLAGGYNYSQNFSNDGVTIVFDWTGPVKKIKMNISPPFQTNILYDQKPWRCFIPTNMTNRMLRVVRIDMQEVEIYKYLKSDINKWTKMLPKKILKFYYKNLKLIFIKKLRDRIRENPCYISIK